MALSVSNQVQMAYIPETVFGTTPATPAMVIFPIQSTTLDLSKDILDDPSVTADRMEHFLRHGNFQVAGNIVHSLQHGQMDAFIEACLGGTWTANVVKVGVVNRSFTIEQKFGDIVQYRRFTGCRVNTWDLNIAPNAVVQSTFGLIGSSAALATAIITGETYTALQNKNPLTHLGSTLTVGGAAVKASALSLKITNNMAARFNIGSPSAVDVTQHELQVNGSITVYFEDQVAYSRFLNETTAAISCQLTDGTNTITIAIPNAKFNTAGLPISGSDALMLSMDFKGLFDGTAVTSVSVTRS